MKFQFLIQTVLYLLIASLAFSIPVNTENEASENNSDINTDIEKPKNSLFKRIDYGTYLSSFINYITTNDV
eukprot:jgi/Orpsp1_1/1182423/evm.model.c7180000081214.1